MKIQDLLFFITIFIFIFFVKKPKISTITGLACLIAAMPLFAKWVFFTAERLTWYAAGFFLVTIIFGLLNLKNNTKIHL